DGTVQAPSAGGPAVAARLGAAFARFHRDVADIDPERLHVTIPDFHNPGRRSEELVELVLTDPHGRVAGSQEVGAVGHELTVHRRLIEVANGWREPAVPTRVAHLDATPTNVLVDDASGDVVAVLDLDTVMPSSWLWDVGDLLRSACCRPPELKPEPSRAIFSVMVGQGPPVPLPEFDPEAADALLDAYRAGVGDLLTPDELAALPISGAVVAYEQSVRFLSDYLEGDRYYAVSHPGENLDRARQQVSLIDPMQAYAERKARGA
ncbi:MAG: MdsC protein, partial [Actinomycetia bacterium]|nr:MdsC protein [Actinomycetes bacterium]